LGWDDYRANTEQELSHRAQLIEPYRLLPGERAQRQKVLMGHRGPVMDVAFTHAAKRRMLASADEKGQIRQWDGNEGSHLPIIRMAEENGRPNYISHEGLLGFAYSTNGKALVSWSPDEFRRREAVHDRIRSGVSLQPSLPPSEQLYPASVAVSPDRSYLSVADRFRGEVLIHNVQKQDESLHAGQIVRRIKPQEGRPLSVAWHPDGERIALGTDVGRVELWEVEDPYDEKQLELL